MNPSGDELQRRYAQESDPALEDALRLGATAYTRDAWRVITSEATRRGLSLTPGPVPPTADEDEGKAPALIYSVGFLPDRLAVWVGVLAWFAQVCHYAARLLVGPPTGHMPLPNLETIGHALFARTWLGLVALGAGFQASRGLYVRAGQAIMVVSLGLIFAEAVFYMLTVRGAL